jgi:hypothetical protein
MFCPVFETLHMSQRETDDTNPIFSLLTDWLAGWLTPHRTVSPQKLTVPQLVKKFPIFYGTWKFITTFTIALHLSTLFARLIHSIPSQPTDLRSILILSSHVQVFQVVYLLKVSPTKLCMHFSSPPCVPHALPISSFLIWSPKWYLVRCSNHGGPYYAIFSSLLLPIPLRPKY